MSLLNQKVLQKVVERVSDELAGDWIMIGGTVLPLLGVDHRVTVDIDMVPFAGTDKQSQLDLMTIASELELPIETINQAGAFFLNNIPHWQDNVVLVRKGKKGSVYRPNLELYFKLKMARLSESDMQDCMAYYKWHQKHEKVSVVTLQKLIKAELTKEVGKEKRNRLETLLKAIKV